MRNLFLHLDTMPEFSRDVEPAATYPHLLIIGGSHAARTASLARSDDAMSVSVTRSGWGAGNSAVEA